VSRDGMTGLFALRSLITYILGKRNKFQMVCSYVTKLFMRDSAKTCFYQRLYCSWFKLHIFSFHMSWIHALLPLCHHIVTVL